MTPTEARQRFKPFLMILVTELLLASALFSSSVYGFAKGAAGQGEDFTRVALDSFLMTIVVYQLRVVPAYLLVALAAAATLYPWLRGLSSLQDVVRGEGRLRRTRLVLWVVGSTWLLYLLSLGPFFRRSPGLIDGAARLLSVFNSKLDPYFLYRWHLLDLATAAFAVVLLYSVGYYARLWFLRLKAAGRLGRVGLIAPVLLGAVLSARAMVPPSVPAVVESPAPLNVLIIASDSLRYDHLGVHGYHRKDISPNIDAFAADATDIRNLHVATASTLESWVSILSSRFPPSHGVRYMYLRKEDAERASQYPDWLTSVLNRAGYETTVVSNWAGNCFKLVEMGFSQNLASDTQNFDSFIMESTIWAHLIFPLYFSNDLGEWLLPEARRVTKYVRPDALAVKMLDRIDDSTRREIPFFGLVFFSTTHLPYTASYPFNIKYVDPNYDGPHRYQIDVQVHDLISTGFKPDLPPETLAHIRNLYDGTVSEFDHYVGQVIRDLKQRGLYERTIIIVTTDHGEDLYDPGSTLGHGTNFLGGDQSTHIPFFIRVPGVTKPGTQVDALLRSVDIAPTLAALLKAPRPSSWQGQDFSHLLRGQPGDLNLPAFAETCYLFFPKTRALVDLTEAERAELLDTSGAKDTLEVDKSFNSNMVLKRAFHDPVIAAKDRMIRTRRWKLVEIPGRTRPILRLYDMQADPFQKVNLASRGLPVMDRLKHALDAYWAGEGADVRWPLAWETEGAVPKTPVAAQPGPG